jgi:DNA mismatch repair protein MutS2
MRAAGDATSQIDAIRGPLGTPSSSPSSFAPAALSGQVQVSRTGQDVTVDMIRPGYRVYVPRLGSGSMEVADVDPSRKEVTVSAGALRARVKVDEISSVTRPRGGGGSGGAADRSGVGHAAGSALERRAKKAAAAAAASGGSRERLSIRTSANTVNVRGERVEEAEAKVDLAISRALSSGKVWIIHGHGTGRLRTGLHSFLKQHSNVEK